MDVRPERLRPTFSGTNLADDIGGRGEADGGGKGVSQKGWVPLTERELALSRANSASSIEGSRRGASKDSKDNWEANGCAPLTSPPRRRGLGRGGLQGTRPELLGSWEDLPPS